MQGWERQWFVPAFFFLLFLPEQAAPIGGDGIVEQAVVLRRDERIPVQQIRPLPIGGERDGDVLCGI
jgi:hypothetical protein